MKYNIDDIIIGDEVTFYSTKQQSNFDEYWTVIGKNKHQVMIELKKLHYDENWTLDIQEVVGHIPNAKR